MAERKARKIKKNESAPTFSGDVGQSSVLRKRKYFTTSQLMVRWGVSAPTVIRLIEEGQLRGLKIRGVYRVALESVESYERKVAF